MQKHYGRAIFIRKYFAFSEKTFYLCTSQRLCYGKICANM